MFTVCSKCSLRLTVTATDLRAAQGYVRCGRCHNVFNALAALADDPSRLAEQPPPTDTQSRRALTLPEQPAPEPLPAQPPASARPAESVSSSDTSLEFNPASTNINEVFIEAIPDERTGSFESITLSAEDPALAAAEPEDAQAEPVIAPQALSAPAVAALGDGDVVIDVDLKSMRDALAEPQPERPVTPVVADFPIPAASRQEPVAAAPEPGAVLPAEDEIPYMSTWSATNPRRAEQGFAVNAAAASEIARALDDADAAAATTVVADAVAHVAVLDPDRATPRLPRWALQGAVGILTLCLIGQVLHHYRAQLADIAMLRRPVNALYQLLSRPLEARWDISRYEIRQLGAATAPAGELVVRASISNRATRDQPLPLLRVVMQDRFGNRVAARDLKPAEYLGRGAPQVSLMAPGQRVDVQVAFRDPGQAATGFEIDACMAGHARAVTCANDPGGH
jgi:predicted Zn finger-like uncharacterized protein